MGAIPEALEEAENFRGLVTARAGLPEGLRELCTFDESAMLILDGEEAGSIYLFPEVESGLVPILSDIRQIIGDYRPDLGLGL